MKVTIKALLVLSLAVAMGCAKKNSNQDGADADSNAYITESAAGVIAQAASDSEGADNSGASGKISAAPSSAAPAASSLSGSCPNSLAPTVRCGPPDGSVSILNYDSNGNGSGVPCSFDGFNFFGQQQMSFNSAAACSAYNPPVSWPAPGSTLSRTLHNFSRYNTLTGRTIRASTDPKVDWQGVNRSGGVVVTYGAAPGDRSIQVPGVGRTLTGRLGRLIFDHSVYTEQPVQVSGFRYNGTRVINGEVKVAHNLARAVSNVNLSNLKWSDPKCCYPTSGSVVNNITGSISGKFTVTFNSSCGLVNFSDVTGHTSTVQLNSCE